jgi:hypothetical protein
MSIATRILPLSVWAGSFILTWAAIAPVPVNASDPDLINASEIREAMEWAGTRMAFLADRTLGGSGSSTVSYTNASGQWTSRNISVWTSGHLPGVFWMLYEWTGKQEWKTRAERWTEALQSRITAADNDTGFQIFCSYGLGITIGGVDDDDYHKAVNDAAFELVRQRYNSTIGCFRSWPEKLTDPADMPFEVNIDQLMNMELVLYAAAVLDRPDWVGFVLSHADRTWEENVRADASTYHVVEYDAAGAVVNKRTHQGWQASSTWSRGQAWAVYGYVMIYRYTGEQRFLEHAIACLDYFLAATAAQSDDGIAYSDFDAPLDSRNPRDTSASAIVASALMELYHHTGEEGYRDTAGRILATLHRSYLTKGTSHQAVLSAASEKWGNAEVGAIFGDYYFIEAMGRFAATIPPVEPVARDEWAGYPVFAGYYCDTGELLGMVYTGHAPWIYLYQHNQWAYIPEESAGEDGLWLLW